MLHNPRNEIRQAYLRAKYQMYVNEQMRQTLASKILVAKDKLQSLNQAKENLYTGLQKKTKTIAHDVAPASNYDFIQNVNRQTDQALEILKRMDEFDKDSKDVENYNNELRLQVS